MGPSRSGDGGVGCDADLFMALVSMTCRDRAHICRLGEASSRSSAQRSPKESGSRNHDRLKYDVWRQKNPQSVRGVADDRGIALVGQDIRDPCCARLLGGRLASGNSQAKRLTTRAGYAVCLSAAQSDTTCLPLAVRHGSSGAGAWRALSRAAGRPRCVGGCGWESFCASRLS